MIKKGWPLARKTHFGTMPTTAQKTLLVTMVSPMVPCHSTIEAASAYLIGCCLTKDIRFDRLRDTVQGPRWAEPLGLVQWSLSNGALLLN